MNQPHFNKMKWLIIAIITISAIAQLLVSCFSYKTTATANQIKILREDLNNATEIHEKTTAYNATYRKANENVFTIQQKNIYTEEGLQNTIIEKIIEKNGINISNFNVKNIPDITKNKIIPSTSGIPWEIFSFVYVTLQGNINLAKLPEFMTFISTQEKLWHIEKLQINPMDNPANFISQFHKIEIELAGGKANEKMTILDAMEKRPNKENLQITMSFFAPVFSQKKEGSK